MCDQPDLRVLCSLEEQRVEAFDALLRELAGLVTPAAVSSVESVTIVEPHEMAPTVNALAEANGMPGSYRANPLHPAEGTCLPLETGGKLRTVILISRSVVEPLSPEHVHQYHAVSTLLEELLHAWVYYETWRKLGSTRSRNKDLLACDEDLLGLASNMRGEYLANRRKAELFRTHPIVEPEPGAGLTVAGLGYPESIIGAIRNGRTEIQSLVWNAAMRPVAPPDAWLELLSILYRKILEPLSRNAAYRDAAGVAVNDEEQLWEDTSCRTLLESCWKSLLAGMRRVYDSEFGEIGPAQWESLSTLRSLVSGFGVTYRRTDLGACWVEFRVA